LHLHKLVPWSEFRQVIEPFYPRAGNGRLPVGWSGILPMYFIANWFNLSRGFEYALYDVPSIRDFAPRSQCPR